MKTAALISSVLIAACARDSRPSNAPAPTPPSSPPATAPAAAHDSHSFTLVDPGADSKQPVKEAVTILHPTEGNQISGTVRFVEVEGKGLDVFAVGHGLSEGPHAFHVHAFGDCSATDGTSAGPHFHFTGSSFDTEAGIITGNLGQLVRHEGGPTSTYRGHIRDASLHGEFSIIGRAVVIHERGNDPAVTPDGAAGARLACGVIGVANPRPPQQARR